MLDKFNWHTPINGHGSGTASKAYIKLAMRFPDENWKPDLNKPDEKSPSTKYSFTLSKGFAMEFELPLKDPDLPCSEYENIPARFSFDDEDHVIMALYVPANEPAYPLRIASGSGYLFQNKDFATKLYDHVKRDTDKSNDQRIFHFDFEWEKIYTKDKLMIFKLTRI